MIAKLIASGDTRDAARRRAIAALRQFPVLGIRTNIAVSIAVLEDPRFIAGDVHTGFLDSAAEAIRATFDDEPPAEALLVARAAQDTRWSSPAANVAAPDPWASLKGWRG
jgi:acetyl/propionyl-CoA carboxylase alpha subunit